MDLNSDQRKNPHRFEELSEFSDAIKKLIKVPKEDVERAEQAARTPRQSRKG